ncbi:MAG: hypothetical protein UY90_C0071G0002 [Candidatus Peregrinibacteria bacterium GW2011_GWA2_54_9]|nr:MAG: hypothetical protein UY90_C0071G0002 [Candidatus Peregrinibacteria bacterium GW2011_GWA2_54_9]
MSEHFHSAGNRNPRLPLDPECATGGKEFTGSEAQAGHLAAAVTLGLQEASSGRWSVSKVNKNPHGFVFHNCAVAASAPQSIQRHVRDVVELCGCFDMSVPVQTARTLQQVNVSEAADIACRVETNTARKELDGLLSILAEDGETIPFYEQDHAAVRNWIQMVAGKVRNQVIAFLKSGLREPECSEEISGKTEEIARIMFATSMALTEIDVLLQKALGESGHHYDEVGFSVLGVVLNEIRDAILARVLAEIASWWPGKFPVQDFNAHLQRYSANVRELRPNRLRTNDNQEHKFRNVVAERLPISESSLNGAVKTLQQILTLPRLSNTLRESSLYMQGQEMPQDDAYYPHGYVSVLTPIDRRWYGHYAVDGAKRRQTIGLYDSDSHETHAFSAMYPVDNPFYATKGYLNFHISHGNTVFPVSSNHLAPRLPYTDIQRLEEPVIVAARVLNMQMRQRAVQYRELFERAGEVSPLIFVDRPDDEIVLFPSNEQLDYDIPPLLGSTMHLPQAKAAETMTRCGAAIAPGNWSSVCQPVLEQKIQERTQLHVEEPKTAQTAVQTAIAREVDPVAEEQARLRRELRGFTAPTLQDFLRILGDVDGVEEVVHQSKPGKGSGSHKEIVVTFSDGRTTKQTTWRKIQRSDAKVTWPTLFKMITPDKLDIPLEEFLAVVQANGHLKPARKSNSATRGANNV